MSEMVWNEATCSGCGYDVCLCSIPFVDDSLSEYPEYTGNVRPDEDREDYLPLPEPVVNVATEDYDRGGDDLLIPPPITEILVNERRAELADLRNRRRTENRQRSNVADDRQAYPML